MQNSNFQVADASLSQPENTVLRDVLASDMELKLKHSQGVRQLHKPSPSIRVLAPGVCFSEPQQCACSVCLDCKTTSPTTFYLSIRVYCFSSHDILALLERAENGGKNLALHLYRLVCAHNHLTRGAEALGKAPNVYVP